MTPNPQPGDVFLYVPTEKWSGRCLVRIVGLSSESKRGTPMFWVRPLYGTDRLRVALDRLEQVSEDESEGE